jgi:hypothetical protein
MREAIADAGSCHFDCVACWQSASGGGNAPAVNAEKCVSHS